MVQRGDDHALVLVGSRGGHRAVDQAYRRLAQHTGRLAAIVAIDHAALRRVRGRVDAGAAHRRAVEGADVTAGACEDDWSIRIGAIEIGARRHPPFAHRRLVVAAPEQPRARRQRATVRRDARHQLLHAADAPQIEHRRQQLADLPDVRVRVVQPRDERSASEIDPVRLRAGPVQHVFSAPDADDAAPAHGDRARDRGLAEGDDVAVVQNEIGRRLSAHAGVPAWRSDTASMAPPTTSRPSRSMSSGITSGGRKRTQLL